MGALGRCVAVSMLSCGLAWATGASAQDYKVKVTPAPAPAGGGDKPAQDTAAESSGVVGGYSWGGTPKASKASKRRAPRIKKHYDRDTPIVTYPGFRVLPDGTSLIWVTVSKTVPVQVERAKGRVTYRLEGAHVQVWNNTNPLVTTHFRTPVASMRLRPGEEGARLVVELREDVKPTHEVVAGPRGTMLLRIEVPPGAAEFPAAHVDSAPEGSMATTAPDPKPKLERSTEVEANGSAHAKVEASASFNLSNKKSKKDRRKHKKKHRRHRD